MIAEIVRVHLGGAGDNSRGGSFEELRACDRRGGGDGAGLYEVSAVGGHDVPLRDENFPGGDAGDI
jgi:hypothetical protein